MASAAGNTVKTKRDVRQSPVTFTVVIPTRRRPQHLARLLAALEPQIAGRPGRDAVVVNDGSHGAAYERAIEPFRGWVRYIALSTRRGPAGARNVGTGKATGRYLVFTDDDCVPPPQWLDWLTAILEDDPDIVAVGGPPRPLLGPAPGIVERFCARYERYAKPELSDGEVLLLPTVNMAVRRDWFDKVGGFRAEFEVAGGEDLNLCYRLKRAGAKLHVDPIWFTRHDLGGGLVGHLRRHFRYGYGTAQHAVLEGDDGYYGLDGRDTVLALLRRFPASLRSARAGGAALGRDHREARRFAVLDALTGLVYRLGGAKGYRRYRRPWPTTDDGHAAEPGVDGAPVYRSASLRAAMASQGADRQPVNVTFSVVIPTHRRPRDLERLLLALEPQVSNHSGREIVVVNDGSHDDAYAGVVARFRSVIEYVVLPENQGCGAACNAGAQRAKRRWLVFTDDDCVPPAGWLDDLVGRIRAHPPAVAVGGTTRALPPARRGMVRGLVTDYCTAKGQRPQPWFYGGRPYCLVTANLAVRRDAFLRLGGFDERYRYGHDLLFTPRLVDADAPLLVDAAWYTGHAQDWGLADLLGRAWRYGVSNGRRAALGLGTACQPHATPRSLIALLVRAPAMVREARRLPVAGERRVRRLALRTIDVLYRAAFELGLMRGFRDVG